MKIEPAARGDPSALSHVRDCASPLPQSADAPMRTTLRLPRPRSPLDRNAIITAALKAQRCCAIGCANATNHLGYPFCESCFNVNTRKLGLTLDPFWRVGRERILAGKYSPKYLRAIRRLCNYLTRAAAK